MSYYDTIIGIIFPIIFPYYVTFRLLFFLLWHYLDTIIPILFTIIFDYFRGSCPNWEELADTNSRPMRPEMTDKCPGAPAVLWDEQKSLLYQYKSTYPAVRRLLYVLFFLLYWLFWLSDQDWAGCNLDLRTAGWHTMNLWDVSLHRIKKRALLSVTRAQFMPFTLYYSYYVTIIFHYTHNLKTRKCDLGAY